MIPEMLVQGPHSEPVTQPDLASRCQEGALPLALLCRTRSAEGAPSYLQACCLPILHPPSCFLPQPL